ncbi:hypothetical protein [Reichenbachiella versicolor]|uniref:hypothetical protein n=1 Tax=Reichenbachiella versicolor TaxID=1821036 RepID=UPI000D6E5D2B|nr:hypothetical protein [Reichenbachiella versicolor]
MSKIIKETWQEASSKLSFEIIMPYKIESNDFEVEVFGFLPNYGSENGMLVEIMYPPYFEMDRNIIQWAKGNDCFYAFINADEYLKYDKNKFMEILEDWKIE